MYYVRSEKFDFLSYLLLI